MTRKQVRFVYQTGLKRSMFTNARLLGTWDTAGRPSPLWSELTMTEGIAADGCPAFTATVELETGKKSFDAARPEILRELKQRYVDAERSRILVGYSDTARAAIRTEIVDQLVPKVDAAEIARLHREATMRGGASQPK